MNRYTSVAKIIKQQSYINISILFQDKLSCIFKKVNQNTPKSLKTLLGTIFETQENQNANITFFIAQTTSFSASSNDLLYVGGVWNFGLLFPKPFYYQDFLLDLDMKAESPFFNTFSFPFNVLVTLVFSAILKIVTCTSDKIMWGYIVLVQINNENDEFRRSAKKTSLDIFPKLQQSLKFYHV